MIKTNLLKIWRVFPTWLQEVMSRIFRPLFQVFAVAVIFNTGNQILLVKSTYQRSHPWGLPGGSLDYGEHPEDTVVRELFEETGLNIEIERFIFVKTWLPDRVGLYYLCRIKNGEFHPSDEVSEYDYFSLENLPDVRPLDIGVIKQLFGLIEHELA